jgi:hypothetical protein
MIAIFLHTLVCKYNALILSHTPITGESNATVPGKATESAIEETAASSQLDILDQDSTRSFQSDEWTEYAESSSGSWTDYYSYAAVGNGGTFADYITSANEPPGVAVDNLYREVTGSLSQVERPSPQLGSGGIAGKLRGMLPRLVTGSLLVISIAVALAVFLLFLCCVVNSEKRRTRV